MITKKMARRLAPLSLIVSLFGMGLASAQSSCIYGSSGEQFCPISSSGFFNGVSAGVQNNAVSALGGLSNLSTLFVTALFVLLILAFVYIIAIKLILPFFK
jgi:hypothetical protein